MFSFHQWIRILLFFVFVMPVISGQNGVGDEKKIPSLVRKVYKYDTNMEQAYKELYTIDNWHKSTTAQKMIPELLTALENFEYNHQMILYFLREMKAKEAAPYFVGLLDLSKDYALQSSSRISLVALGEDAIPAIVAYRPASPVLIETLGVIGRKAKTAIPKLIVTLAHRQRSIRSAANLALTRIDPQWVKLEIAKEAIPDLVLLLKDNSEVCREQSATILSQISEDWYKTLGAQQQIPVFEAAFFRQVSKFISRIEGENAHKAHVSKYIKKDAYDAMRKLTESLQKQQQQMDEYRKKIQENRQYVVSPKSKIPRLISKIKEKQNTSSSVSHKEDLLGIISTLHKLGSNNSKMVPHLTKLLVKSSGDLQAASILLLGSISSDSTILVGILREKLYALVNRRFRKSSSEAIFRKKTIKLCETIIEALGRGGKKSKSSVHILIQLSQYDNWTIASAAKKSLFKVGPYAFSEIIKALYNPKIELPIEIVNQIVEQMDKSFLVSLIRSIKDLPENMHHTLFKVLEKVDENWYAHKIARNMIPQLMMDYCLYPGIQRQEVLHQIDADWYDSNEAKSAVADLRKLLQHNSWMVRKKAYATLQKVDFENMSQGVAIWQIFLVLVLSLLILGIFVYSFYVLIKQGRLLVIANLVQPILFCMLFICFYYFLGNHLYEHVNPVKWYDWLIFIFSHTLRAVDFLDFIEAYDISIQNIKHKSHLVGTIIVTMHCLVDIFLFAALATFLAKKTKALLETSKFLAPIGIRTIIVIVVVYLFTAFHEGWRFVDVIFLWGVDNILRLVDVGDIMQTFNWRLHEVDKTLWNSTLAISFRIMFTLYLGKELEKYRLKLSQGVGLTVDKLCEILRKGDTQMRKVALTRLGEMGLSAEQAFGDVLLALTDRNFAVRKLAVQTLAKIDPQWQQSDKTKQMASKFVEIVRNQKLVSVKKASLEVLGEIGPNAKQVIPDLISISKKSDGKMQRIIQQTLKKIEPKWREKYALLRSK